MANDDLDFTLIDYLGHEVVMYGTSEVSAWLDQEREAWAWLRASPHEHVNISDSYLEAYDPLATMLQQFENDQVDAITLKNTISGAFRGEHPTLLLSDQGTGAAIGQIRETIGLSEGEMALAFATGRRSVNLTNAREFRLWQLVCSPSIIGPDEWLRQNQSTLANAKTTLRSAITRQNNDAMHFEKNWTARQGKELLRYRSVFATGMRLAHIRARKIQARAERQVELIQDTRAAYTEHMRLKAAVDYWSSKGVAHGESAVRWGAGLAAYLLGAVILAAVLFEKAWAVLEGSGALTGKHFLIVAAVGAVLTLLFWIARLGVRIFLGERHLFTDAEERRVMTQAYLALINEGAASEQERMIILSALFRTAQDGIVKDDGAGDLSLPAMVARLLEAKR